MMDEDHDDGLGGRSRDRREFTEDNRWAVPLCRLTPAQLAAAPIPEAIREVVREAVAVGDAASAGRARNRLHQRVDKLVRLLDESEVLELDTYLEDPEVGDRAVEAWCDDLIRDGDPALDTLIAANPSADRQRFRTLARNARRRPADRAPLRAALVALPNLVLP